MHVVCVNILSSDHPKQVESCEKGALASGFRENAVASMFPLNRLFRIRSIYLRHTSGFFLAIESDKSCLQESVSLI